MGKLAVLEGLGTLVTPFLFLELDLVFLASCQVPELEELATAATAAEFLGATTARQLDFCSTICCVPTVVDQGYPFPNIL